ncbi:hypothetical protein [Nonomuraea sp. NPDC050310]|uniref:hypothetical protein n=1 Tax=Nonomuraea sp. NPDC050310 TaxID=3154935 RepID=UPI0033D632AE
MRASARRLILAAGWVGAAGLAVVAPGNVVMRLVFGKTDDPALGWQLVLGGVGLVLGGVLAGWSARRQAGRGAQPDVRPSRWIRVVTWGAAAVPVAGFSVPHLLWGLGVPFGVAGGAGIGELGGSPVFWGVLVAGPVAGAGLTLGLVSRWGRVIGGWRVPRWVAVVRATVVGLLVAQYGAMMTGCLAFGVSRTCAPGGGEEVLDGNWGFAGTYPVFLLWGVLLLAAVVGYVHTTAREG